MTDILQILALIMAAYAIWKSYSLPEYANNVPPADLANPSYVSLLKWRLNLSAWALLIVSIPHILAVLLAIETLQSGSKENIAGFLLLDLPRLGGLALCFIAALTYPMLRIAIIISLILAIFLTVFTFGIGLILIIPTAIYVTAIAGIAIVFHSLRELMRLKWELNSHTPQRENPAPRVENPTPVATIPTPEERDIPARRGENRDTQVDPPRRRTRFRTSETVVGLEVSGSSGKIIISPHERMPRVMRISEYGRISPNVILSNPPFAFIAPNREGKGMWLLEPLLDDVGRIQIGGVALSPGNANTPLPPRCVITLSNSDDASTVCGTLVVKYKPYIARPAQHSEEDNLKTS